MKIFNKIFLAMIPPGILTIFLTAGYYRDEPVQAEFSTEQVIEAEWGKINGPIQKFQNKEASGGAYILNHYTLTKRLGDPGLQEDPDVSYTFDIPQDGDYFLWLRAKVPFGGYEAFGKYLSLYIGSDNKNYNTCIVMIKNGWQWQRITNLRLNKGKHTIDIKHRDFGFGIDQLFVTATGSDLSGLGANPSEEDILRNNFNIPEDIIYPPLTENDGAGLDFPKPPSEHPRLFLRSADIPGLIEKSKDPLMKTAWDKIIESSSIQTDGLLDAPVDGNANFSMKTINAIEAKALMYVLYKDKKQGRDAVDAMLNFFNTVKFNPSTGDISRFYGRFILADAIVYDWCYDLLNDEERSALIKWAETMAFRMEIGWPVIRQGAVTGHGSEFQLIRDILSAGIAMYDEKKEIYMLAAGRFFKNYVPARKFFYPAGYHHQGSSYGGFRLQCELYATFLFDRMGYPMVFGEDQKKVPYFALYTRRPDGQIMRDGDDHAWRRRSGLYLSSNGPSDLLSASYFKDPVIMGEAMRELKGFGNTDDYLFEFLLADPSVKPEPLDKQPLSKYFPSPLGAMVARTGWEPGINSSTAVAVMKLAEYQFLNHQHLDGGNFQFYYKGILASESGCYDAYGTSHDYNYHKRTIAHNSILVYDPQEKIIRDLVNDGGQRFPNESREPVNLDVIFTKGHKTGKILAHGIGPDPVRPEFTYLKGDLTKAYTGKMRQFERSFVFLNMNEKDHPAALIVFDKVISSDRNFKKTWLLHCIEEPEINGSVTTIVRTQKGYNGKLVNKTLLPEGNNVRISKIGGPGHEFDVGGANYPVVVQLDPENTTDESGSWRIEISPSKQAEQDLFLNVMHVMDNNGGPEPLEVFKIKSDKVTGAMIGDRVVIFNKDPEKNSDKIGFILSGEGTLKVLVTALCEGRWELIKPGEKSGVEYEVKKDGGWLYFTSSKGKHLLARK